MKVFISGFSPESSVISLTEMAGLLARFLLNTFPSHLKQWYEDSTVYKAYSYGDSAGITPDFPFNPLMIFCTGLQLSYETLLRRTLVLLKLYAAKSSSEPYLRQK